MWSNSESNLGLLGSEKQELEIRCCALSPTIPLGVGACALSWDGPGGRIGCPGGGLSSREPLGMCIGRNILFDTVRIDKAKRCLKTSGDLALSHRGQQRVVGGTVLASAAEQGW